MKKMNELGRQTKNEARREILRAANKKRPVNLEPFTMSRIQQAVFKCRQKQLVESVVLRRAGYRAKRA